MRTRTNNKVLNTASCTGAAYTYVNTFCNGTTGSGTSSFPAINNVISAERDERITDSLGKGLSHACTHRVHPWIVSQDLTSIVYGSTSAGQNVVQSYNRPLAWFDNNAGIRSYHGWDVSNNTSVPPFWTLTLPGSENVLKEDVLERAKGLKADLLLDYAEANQMWPSVTSLATSLPNMARSWRDLRKVVRTASGAYLAWKFGVSPVLSDIQAVHRYLPNLVRDVKRHAAAQASRYSSSAVVLAAFSQGEYQSSMQNGFKTVSYTHQGRSVSTPVVRYVLVVKPKTKYHTAFFNAADTLASRFATSPASFAWEKVPFSFVVDWFVDLRGALRAADNILGSSPYEVVSFTRSYGYHLATDCYLDLYSPCNGGKLAGFRQCSLEYKHYERSIVSLGASLPSLNPRFGKNQAGISAALISQQLSKIRR